MKPTFALKDQKVRVLHFMSHTLQRLFNPVLDYKSNTTQYKNQWVGCILIKIIYKSSQQTELGLLDIALRPFHELFLR